MKPYAAIQSALFVAAISLPLAANLAGRDGADPLSENRELARPADGVFAWFEDHFGFRAALVRWNARVRYSVLGTSPSAAVVRGTDGWLFYAEDGALEDYIGGDPLSPDGVNAWRDTVVGARNLLRARGRAACGDGT